MKNTARLILDKPVKEDFDRFYEIHSDPETNLFNPNGAMSLETAKMAFNEMLEHWDKNQFGTWSIKEIEKPNYVIGFGGLADRLYGEEIKLNLGYRFDKDFWGKGYATELANKTIAFGLHELNKPELFAIVRPQHYASIKVLEKSNMKLIGELNDVENAANSLVYSIKK
ncbi:GNAT family N-acetyltransferase [Flavobacterium aquatile]|uniref:GNAT family acetyltraansferase n=1 Tax=Flavobacterium aquatile LMG 4008 = ATCC 11947 TaxID=1453498 RepID=A0A095UY85_9FLAO|nr:GNAT family N-acetyltransferase [Flavobacterium aquatile]KGD67540.1 GNAT family acetyltraansferase [Flavobacterium aquatile LMG 4008 = ATCC 11947]OXA65526.1 N-acetyltransferase [Flavobacterium aquatile] [Flavobacterium aquatile LMG 4008 = ATCC 11947]GEC79986.1 GNAT family acetyltransferase [Flavobacterium aquatile]